jgi:predicted transcriptional regulator
MSEPPKAESYTAYLEAKQRIKESRPTTGGGSTFSLLRILATASDKQMSVANLMATSSMAFGEFAEALKSLGELGYLTLSGSPSNEIATLTKQGEEIANLSRK